MKKFKKIFAAIAASALVAAMSFTSMAASITIKRGDAATVPGAASDTVQYTYYRVLKANIAGDNVSYYVDNETLKNAIVGNANLTALFDVHEYTEDGNKKWNVVPKKDYRGLTETETKAAAEEIASAFDEIKGVVPQDPQNPEYFGTFYRDNGTGEASTTLPGDGYYLIVSSLGTKLAVQTAGSANIEINEKNEYPSLTKSRDKETASYGDKITYTVNVDIPASVAAEEDIVVVDTMSNGLTPFDGDDEDNLLDVTAKVEGSELTGDKAVTVLSQDNNVINIKIPAAAVTAYKGKEVVLTYQAVLNNKAKTNEVETNTAHLEYANYKSLDSSVDVTAYDFVLTKVDGAKKDTSDPYIPAAAGNAEFTLWDSLTGGKQIMVSLKSDTDNTYRVLTNDETPTVIYAGGSANKHSATIEGLAAGKTYYLQEEKAPTGYNKLTERKAITVEAKAAGENKVDVENNAGIQLPSTGGMGTTVFAIVGLLVMAGAAVTLIIKKRA